jgi:predicted dehydrogenase
MSATVRFGIIGAGAIAPSLVKSLAKHPHAAVSAVYDVHAGRQAAMCDEFAIPKRPRSLNALLQDDEIDAIYVAVPNKFHVPYTLKALAAGKHVVAEKPFAMNLEEAKQVEAAVRKSGKMWMLGMNRRFPAMMQKAQALVAKGAIGEPYHAKARWQRMWGCPRLQTWFGHKAISGGGCLLDIGVHMLDQTMYIAGNFKPLTCSGSVYGKFGHRGLGEGGWGKSDRDPKMTFDVEDFANAHIRLAGGLSIDLDVSWAAYMPKPVMETVIYGTEGTIWVGQDEAVAGGSEAIRLCTRKKKAFVVDEAPKAKIRYPHCDRFNNFVNAVLGKEEPCVTIDQALAVQAILSGIYRSSSTGTEVDLRREFKRR